MGRSGPSWRYDGRKKLEKNLRKSLHKIAKAAGKSTVEASVMVLDEAQARIPIKYGNLWESGFVVGPEGVEIEYGSFVDGDGIFAADLSAHHEHAKKVVMKRLKQGAIIGFSVPYALIVHERVELNHPVGEALFLTKALEAVKGELLKAIASRTKRRG